MLSQERSEGLGDGGEGGQLPIQEKSVLQQGQAHGQAGQPEGQEAALALLSQHGPLPTQPGGGDPGTHAHTHLAWLASTVVWPLDPAAQCSGRPLLCHVATSSWADTRSSSEFRRSTLKGCTSL